jgi:archaemetzincin
MGAIRVVPLPGASARALESLLPALEDAFHIEVELAEPLQEVQNAYDVSRDQYGSRALLAALLEERADGARRVLGVTSLDLFVPVLTFVFGEAQLGGKAAVVSTCRLESSFYGLPDDGVVLQTRLEKEAIHELGHTYGLLHCQDTRCVMRSSTYVEEIDLKDTGFCTPCARWLAKAKL